eukprot:1160058-Pelagomonas_calceolata.AAC.18
MAITCIHSEKSDAGARTAAAWPATHACWQICITARSSLRVGRAMAQTQQYAERLHQPKLPAPCKQQIQKSTCNVLAHGFAQPVQARPPPRQPHITVEGSFF